jgi:hypothetical protein
MAVKQEIRKIHSSHSSVWLVGLASILISGCTQQFNARSGIDPKSNVQAPAAVNDSFKVQLSGHQLGVGTDQAHLTLKKSSLDKEFLLMGSLIMQQPVPSFTGLRSRVVAFKEINSKLFLLDANSGHQVTANLPMNLLLTEFPIIKETDTSITFDFNAGMSKIFTQGDWFAEDEGGGGYKYDLGHATVTSSYINSARLSVNSNVIVIEQVAQIDMRGDVDSGPSASPTTSLPVTARYYLTPYTPNKNFIPSQSPADGMKTFGYFEVAPQLNSDGSSFIRSSKWDVSAPIVYAISANTPDDFRQPIRDAVLYWNKFFGKNVMQVIQLDDKNITAPDPEYNIIQWVENDSAGAAYADAQMDPRSGQILHAQIYLTSVFGSLGKVRGEKELRDDALPTPHVTIKGFSPSSLCRYDNRQALTTLEGTLSTTALSKNQALKIAQDYVRETVAHEVGHTLGLRHNFAGSLGANFALSDRKTIYSQYLKNGKAADDVRTTSSIMDYELFEESTLMGDQISRQVGDLTYDRAAIRRLYFAEVPKSSPAFCTDTDVNKYQDCQTFDTGRTLLEGSLWMVQNALDTAPINLMNTYISAKAPISLSAQPLPVEKVPLNPLGASITTMSPRFPMFRALTKAGGLVAVRSTFPFISSLNSVQVKAAEVEYVDKNLSSGGLISLFPAVSDQFSAQAYAQFSQLLDTKGYESGFYNGKAYQFSDAEKSIMRTNAKLYFDRMQDLLVENDLLALAGSALPKDPSVAKAADDDSADASALKSSPVVNDLSDAYLQVVTSRMDKYIFTASKATISAKITVVSEDSATPNTVISVQLPKFAYPFKIRLATAQLLGKTHSENIAWALSERIRYSDQFVQLITKSLGGNSPDKIDQSTLSHEAAQWLVENAQILASIKGDGGN